MLWQQFGVEKREKLGKIIIALDTKPYVTFVKANSFQVDQKMLRCRSVFGCCVPDALIQVPISVATIGYTLPTCKNQFSIHSYSSLKRLKAQGRKRVVFSLRQYEKGDFQFTGLSVGSPTDISVSLPKREVLFNFIEKILSPCAIHNE